MEAILKLFGSFVRPFNCALGELSSNPIQRLKPLPELPLEIWLEIFQFATHVHQHTTIAPLDPFALKRVSTNVLGVNTPSFSTRTKLSLVLVCRAWRRIAIQMLYEYLVIRSPARADAILAALRTSARSVPRSSDLRDDRAFSLGHGQWTRHIEIYTHARGASSIRYLQTIFQIFQACPNLRMLSGTWNHLLPNEFLRAISRIYGPSLEGLYWNEDLSYSNTAIVATPEFLASFHSLRILDLRNYSGDYSEGESATATLPRVQDLIVSTRAGSISAATALSLPALSNLTVKTIAGISLRHQDLLMAFLKVHGFNLINVDLPSPSADSEPDPDSAQYRRTAAHINPDIFLQPQLCPNLVTLTFPSTSPPLSAHVHKSIRRIGLRGVRAESLYPDKGTNAKGHLLTFTPEKYPNLEVVKTVGFLVDADTDALIKDIFIWWVEKFEKIGVDFLDGEGVLWAYAEPSDCEVDKNAIRGSISSSRSTPMVKDAWEKREWIL